MGDLAQPSDEMQLVNALDVFEQHANYPPRHTRRSSILKPYAENAHEGRRTSKRISFHQNIFCQQLLADGTTQVITENLKAKLPDSTQSTVSDEGASSRYNCENIDPSHITDENDTKRKSTEPVQLQLNPSSAKRSRRDPAQTAKSYQRFMKKTYDEKDDAEYETIYNTSVNRLGYEIAPRDARLDITRLFAVDNAESNMELTLLVPTPSGVPDSAREDEITSTTMSLVDFSRISDQSNDKTLGMAPMDEEFSNDGPGNVSEMDTAMIIEDDLEVTEDDVFESGKQEAPKIIEQSSIDEISMSIIETSNFEPSKNDSAMESRSMVISQSVSISMLHEEMVPHSEPEEPNEEESLNLEETTEKEDPVAKSGLLRENDLEVREEEEEVVERAEDMNEESKEENEKSIEHEEPKLGEFEGTEVVAELEEPESDLQEPEQLEPGEPDEILKEELMQNSIVGDVSEDPALIDFDTSKLSPITNKENITSYESGGNDMIIDRSLTHCSLNQSLSKTHIYSDNTQANGMSIEVDLNEPSPPNSQELSAGTQPMDKETTAFGDKSATFHRRQTLSKIISRMSFPRSLDIALEMRKRQLNQTYLDSLQKMELSSSLDSFSSPQIMSPALPVSSREVSSLRLSSNCSTPKKSPLSFEPRRSLQRSVRVEEDEEEVKQVHQESPDFSEKLEPEKVNLESDLATSFESSSSTSSDAEMMDVNFDKSYNIPGNELDDETGDGEDDVHEDSMFEIVNRIHESSFVFSPDSSFHSSFICRDDTLALQAEDLECKLNSFVFATEEIQKPEKSIFQDVFLPLRRFEAAKYGAHFDLSHEDQATILYLYDMIQIHVTFGKTVRSFNGIPIKVLKKVTLETTLATSEKFQPNNSGSNFLIKFGEDHKCFFATAIDLIASCFDGNKSQLLEKHPTSDLLPDLLREIGNWVLRAKELLHELSAVANFTNCHYYQKTENAYEYAFELPGPRRNFFLIIPIDPKTYPFQVIQPRFGFHPEDKGLVSVNNFAKALAMYSKPGNDYIKRMIDNSKKFICLCRKLERRKKRNTIRSEK